MIRDWIFDHANPRIQELLVFLGRMDWFDWTVAIVGFCIVFVVGGLIAASVEGSAE